MRRWITALILALAVASTPARPVEASWLFNGNNGDYFTVAANAAYNFSGDFTITAYIKCTAGSAAIGAVATMLQTNTFGMGHDSSDHLYDVDQGVSAPTVVCDGTWKHVAQTMNRSTPALKFYINGVQDHTSSTTMSAGSGNGTPYIGNLGAGTAFPWVGQIAFVTLWTSALSPGNIVSIRDSPTPETVNGGTTNVGSWHMCNPSDLADSSTGNRILTKVGAPTTNTSNPAIGCGNPLPKTLLKLKN